MLITEKRYLFFKIKEVHFSDTLFDLTDCAYAKFIYCKNIINNPNFIQEQKRTSVIDLSQDLSEIWSKFNQTNRRYIKRAGDMGIKISIGNDFNHFYKLHKEFRKGKGFYPFLGIGFTKLELIKKHGIMFVAEYNNEILCENIFFIHDTNITYWLSATKRLFTEKEKAKIIGYANRLIFWETIKYAKQNGYNEFDLGGLWPEEETESDDGKKGINSFKLSFGGDIVERFNYYKYYSNTYSMMLKLYQFLVNNSEKK